MSDGKSLIFRALRQDEINQWLDLLGSAFSDKGTPRDFFERNMNNDPWFDINGVRVCVDPTIVAPGNPLVSTVRVYRRRMRVGNGTKYGSSSSTHCVQEVDEATSTKGNFLEVGAIGDVATIKTHRRQGIAGRVLRDAHTYMISQGIKVSVLHTGNRMLHSYYTQHGYHTIPIKTVVHQIDTSRVLKIGDDMTLFGWHPPEEHQSLGNRPDLLRSMAVLHSRALAHRQRRFIGCFQRDHQAYWEKWIANAVAHADASVWVVLDRMTDQVMAYAIIRYGAGPVFGHVAQVQEYFYDVEHFTPTQGGIGTALAASTPAPRILFQQVMQAAISKLSTGDDQPTCLRISTALIDHRSWLDTLVTPVIISRPDDGSMKPLTDNSTLMATVDTESNDTVWMDEGLMFHCLENPNDAHTLHTLLGTQDTACCTFLPMDSF